MSRGAKSVKIQPRCDKEVYHLNQTNQVWVVQANRSVKQTPSDDHSIACGRAIRYALVIRFLGCAESEESLPPVIDLKYSAKQPEANACPMLHTQINNACTIT